MISKKTKNFSGDRSGFTLVFAILIAAVVLAIGASLAGKATRQIYLSSVSKESVKAFYAANTGLECALYWDRKGIDVFPNTMEGLNPPSRVSCNGEDISDAWTNLQIKNTIVSDGTSVSTTFFIGSAWPDFHETHLPLLDRPANSPASEICAKVVVKKTGSATVIKSRGYNTCNLADKRALERGIEASY